MKCCDTVERGVGGHAGRELNATPEVKPTAMFSSGVHSLGKFAMGAFFVAAGFGICAAGYAKTSSDPASGVDIAALAQKAQANVKKGDEADAALQQAVREAGNDQVALVRKLQAYLVKYPDGPRNASVYRALVEGCEQLRDDACALESAERLIALHPDDSDMMLVAVHLLEQSNDDHALTRAAGYLTRIIDRVEKAPPDPTPRSESSATWQQTQDKLRVVLYVTRGRIEERQKQYEAATKDFNTSNKIIQSSVAEEHLGSIAEMQRDLPEAVRHYLLAFVLPEESPAGTVDRVTLRQNLGNVWRQVHGSDVGLSDAVLGEFDHVEAAPTNKVLPRNRDARDVFGFTLRDLEGGQLVMSQERGKTVVLNFWATWCEPCKEMEPLFAQVATEYAGRQDVVFFSIDTDLSEAVVKPFVSAHGWTVPVLFADGLDEFLRVGTLPTVIVVDRSGKIDYRANGFQSEDFEGRLTAAIEKVGRH
jgi:thiol-disulfide isomerase/thioredoxin